MNYQQFKQANTNLNEEDLAIKFAEYHIQAALKEVSNDIYGMVSQNWDYELEINQEEIANYYDLSKLKGIS